VYLHNHLSSLLQRSGLFSLLKSDFGEDRFCLGKIQINLTLVNFVTTQQSKSELFFAFASLKFGFSLGLHYLCTQK